MAVSFAKEGVLYMDTGRVFIACALGGFIGTLVALQIATQLWWLGLIVGGAVGYLSYEFREVLEALHEAWILTSSWRPDWRGFLRRMGMAFSYANKEAAGVFVVLTNLIPLVYFLWHTAGGQLDFQTALKIGLVCIGVTMLFSTFVGFLGFMEYLSKIVDIQVFSNGVRYHPLAVYFYHTPRLTMRLTILTIWYSLVGIVLGARWSIRFSRTFFLLAHSDIRLLCAVDAAIGCAVGYFFNNAIIGALAGSVVGVVNFEIVSKRILRVVPLNGR